MMLSAGNNMGIAPSARLKLADGLVSHALD